MAKKRKTTQKQTKTVKATRYTKHIPNPEEPTPAWELLKEPYEYSEKRSLCKTILVVCQSKEEAAYFKSFPIASLTVVPPREEEATPLDTVLYAQEIVKATAHDFDQVWCVCRTSPEQANSLEAAAKKAHSLGYRIVYSNDSFDLWIWLHYGEMQENYQQALRETLQIDPEKGKDLLFYKRLYNQLEEDPRAQRSLAIERAKKLYQAQEKLPYVSQSPLTNLYELVENLL